MSKVRTQAELISASRKALSCSEPFLELKAILQHLMTLPETTLEKIMRTDDTDVVTSIYISPQISIRKIVMPPAYYGHIHDHNIWTVGGVLQGMEENLYYTESANGLTAIDSIQTTAKDCFMMKEDVIHAVRNPLQQTTISLHFYGGDLMQAQKYIWHPFTYEKFLYDYNKACEFSRLSMECTAASTHPTN